MPRISPAVRREMAELGIEAHEIAGIKATGADQSLTMRDVYRYDSKRHAQAADAAEQAFMAGPAEGESPWARDADNAEQRLLKDHDDLAGRAAAKAEEKTARMKSGTRPWTGSNQRWKTDRFRVPRKPGFSDRWFRKNRVRDAIDVGWRPASKAQRGLRTHDIKLPFAQGESDFIEREGMYLLEIPQEHANDRQRFIAAQTAAQTSSAVGKAIAAGAYQRGGDFGKMKRRRMRPVGRQSAIIGQFASDY